MKNFSFCKLWTKNGKHTTSVSRLTLDGSPIGFGVWGDLGEGFLCGGYGDPMPTLAIAEAVERDAHRRYDASMPFPDSSPRVFGASPRYSVEKPPETWREFVEAEGTEA